jgi:cytochrome bd ubiquinol oxidase subunit I
MDLTALLLSRLQFAFTVSFHIIFPSFTIGLAAWLTVLEALHLWTGRPAYRLVFEFWLKIFGVAFGLGVVSGIVMGFQFGSNWSVLARMSGPIQGPLLALKLSRPFSSKPAFSASCYLAARASRRGSICSQPRWWRSEPRSRRSGSWPITAGCRCRLAM